MMKKIMISIIVIGCLLASSIVSANALTITQKTVISSNEQNPIMKNIFNKNDFLYPIKKGNILHSQGPLTTHLDGNIVPTYFKTWCDTQYYASRGGEETTIVYDGYLYQAVRVFQASMDEWMGLLKYRTSNGSLCDFKIWADTEAAPTGMVIVDDHLYFCGMDISHPTSILLKYNISGDVLNLEENLTIYDGSATQMCTDENSIYICGYPANQSNTGLFLQKYNADLEPIWSEPTIWDGPYDDQCWTMTFYDGSIFLTGSSVELFGLEYYYNSFVLKFDSNGNLLKEVIGLGDRQGGTAIKGYDGKIYVAYAHMGTLSEGYNVNFLISAYDTDLGSLWTSETYDYSNYDQITDMVLIDDYIYASGFIYNVDWINQTATYLNGFIFKGNVSNGGKIWWKVVVSPSWWTDANGISADDSYLYLSGTNYSGSSDYTQAYILKCDFNGYMGPNNPSIPIITGPNKGAKGIEYNYTFVSTNTNDLEMKYFIDWGDGNNITTNFYPSGQEVIVGHTWAVKGSYIIKAKAITIDGYESGWGTLSVKMPLDMPGSQQSQSNPQVNPSPSQQSTPSVSKLVSTTQQPTTGSTTISSQPSSTTTQQSVTSSATTTTSTSATKTTTATSTAPTSKSTSLPTSK